jgi:hypothetical protein
MYPVDDRQGTWLPGQTQTMPPDALLTQCDPPAQQTWPQTFAFGQQMLPAVNTVPCGQTHVPLDATMPFGQQ